jgi:hypothetical protein
MYRPAQAALAPQTRKAYAAQIRARVAFRDTRRKPFASKWFSDPS